MIDRAFLKQQAERFGLQLTEEMLEQFDSYAEFLVEYNEKVNLTAITEPKEIAIKHFLDSVAAFSEIEIPKNASVIDVGTGAGFPSVPLKIYRGDINLTLLDSLNKRIVFLQQLTERLHTPSTCIHARAEEAGRKPQLREKFDFATARAVANLRDLCEYCLPFVKVGGYFVALKGYDCDEELEAAKPAIAILGGKVEKVIRYPLDGENHRSVILIKKISQMSTKYPRPSAKIAKSPLR